MDKNFLLKESKSFCILPWIHIHTSPVGKIYPCCISRLEMEKDTLKDAFHSKEMNQLRYDMLNDIQNPVCNSCYKMDNFLQTSRVHHNNIFSHKFDEVVPFTKSDGSLDEMKLSYFDVRFSNICNMKCRMCFSDYSSQWAKEENRVILNDDNKFLPEILEQINNLELVYFAGGEPLITEQHYVVLEELIRAKKDVPLIYSTNASMLKFKSKDLFDLWKHFSNIQLRVSMDHYGKKAEYIRHGTHWDTIESNILKFKYYDNIDLNILTVVSIYNYSDLPKIHNYIVEKELLKINTNWQLYNLENPKYLNILALTKTLKDSANLSIKKHCDGLDQQKFQHIINQMMNSVNYSNSGELYSNYKDEFAREIKRLDKIRNENFESTFPELMGMLNE
jgi:MoaA/NifB/PqqE/SkfB family radical SAM enzyme